MKYIDYIRDQLSNIGAQLFAMISCCVFLRGANAEAQMITIMLLIWLIIWLIHFNFVFFQRRNYLREIQSLVEKLDKKYLIGEIMKYPSRADDRVYYSIIKAADKSMMEEISSIKRERIEYKDYIEQWIHEIKTPIAAIKLLCENHKTDLTREFSVEVEKIAGFTEQALYYARSENVVNDYMIKEILLSEVIHASILDNKQLLIQNSVSIHLKNCEQIVYSDEKWIEFILNQIIINAVKYRSEDPSLVFEVIMKSHGVILRIIDNGVGIPKSDLPRIFDKGFTGQNGRIRKYSTGIGLYLCYQLCSKLGIEIYAESEQGKQTCITLQFPKGKFF